MQRKKTAFKIRENINWVSRIIGEGGAHGIKKVTRFSTFILAFSPL